MAKAKEKPESTLRDFVYLDRDRLGSMAVQLLGEAPLDGSAAADVRLYLQVEDKLRSTGRLTALDSSTDLASAWTKDTLRDGMFVRAVGAIRLMDFRWTGALMTALPRMVKFVQNAQMATLKRQGGGNVTKTDMRVLSNEHQNQLNELKEARIDELTELVQQLYSDVV